MIRWPLSLPRRAPGGVDVVSLGENSLDFVGIGPRISATSDKTSLSAFDLFVGGQATTAAVACARQGWTVCYIGSFGDDEWRETVVAALAREQIDVVPIGRAGARSRAAIVLVDEATGDRSVFEFQDPRLRMRADDVPADAIRSARVLMLDATHPDAALEAARVAVAAKVPVIIDVDRSVPSARNIMALASVIVVPELFLSTWTAQPDPEAGLAALAAEFGAPVTIVTLGPAGSLARIGGRDIRTPGVQVDVRDSTGAGDAFRGGLVSAWLAVGDGADSASVLAWANATAALNCRAIGAQTALPSRDQVEVLVTRGPHGQSN